MSQAAINVDYTLQARSFSGAVVANYDDLDLGYTIALPTYHAENSNDGTDLNARLSLTSGQWDDGVLTFSTTTASFNRSVAPDGPYSNLQLGLQIVDPDGADFSGMDFKPADNNNCVLDGDCTGVAIGNSLNTGFGRMHLQNAFGPELAAIPMSWQTEIWDGSKFVMNSNDHCTKLALTDVTFTGAASVVNAATDIITVTLGGTSSDFSFNDPVGGSDCLTATDIIFCDGKAGTQYGAPGARKHYVNLGQ
jgi:MSHA biogenesis protein MshQ